MRHRSFTSVAKLVALSCCLALSSPLLAQIPIATGNGAVPAQSPTFPAICGTPLTANLKIVASTANPANMGGAPSGQTTTNPDGGRIQTALTNCANTGKAVELSTDGSGHYAFLSGPLTLPAGVTLLIDAGVTLFGSANPADYQISGDNTCGTLATNGTGCQALINVSGSANTGVMGYGVVNGQADGGLVDSSQNPILNTNDYPYCGAATAQLTWHCLATQARSGSNGGKTEVSPKLVNAYEAGNFTLYETTFLESPYFNVDWNGGDTVPDAPTKGLMVWGVKIISPGDMENTDGIDLVKNVEDATIVYSSISNGDDQLAFSADNPGYGSNPPLSVQNVTVGYVNTYDGFGLSIGSTTGGGIKNILYTNINQSGDTNQALAAGLHIKSDDKEGGAVDTVTYENICQQNVNMPMEFLPYQGGEHGGGTGAYPSYTNLTIQNYNDLGGGAGGFILQGYSNYPKTPAVVNPTTIAMSNLTVAGTIDLTYQPTDDSYTTAPQNLEVALGPYQVPSAFSSLQTNYGANNVTVTGSTTSTTAYACPATSFPYLVGAFYGAPGTQAGTVVLTAVIEPATWELPSFAADDDVDFYEGGNYVGANSIQSLGGGAGTNGTVATTTLTGVSSGTHFYTAKYNAHSDSPYYGSAYYKPFYFGGTIKVVVP